MICVRRALLRVLSASPSVSTSLQCKSQRSITSFTNRSINPLCLRISTPVAFQRRWLNEEATTQSEPEADGATQASQGNNSIAASANSSAAESAPEPTEPKESSDSSPSAVDDDANKASETTSSAARSATKTASSTAERVSQTVQSAKQSVSETVQSLGAAAGVGSESSSRAPQPEKHGVGGLREGEPSKTLYIGNLFFDVRSEDLKKEFERAGPVVNAKVIMDSRGLSKGFGYVEFENIESATQAINLFNLQNFEGRRLSVQYSISSPVGSAQNANRRATQPTRPQHAPTKTLFIGNMSFDMSDRDLNNLFREIKNVIDVRVAIDRRTGQPRGFAHADFVDVKDAERAMEGLQGKEVCGRTLRVDFSTSTGRAAMGARPADEQSAHGAHGTQKSSEY